MILITEFNKALAIALFCFCLRVGLFVRRQKQIRLPDGQVCQSALEKKLKHEALPVQNKRLQRCSQAGIIYKTYTTCNAPKTGNVIKLRSTGSC